MPYDHSAVEPRWQAFWEENGTFRMEMDPGKPKFYALDMFPYPSGSGLHMGHPAGYTATDIISRMKRMQGHCVLHPMGWDAFGLPAERAAVRSGIHPAKITAKNINNFRRQVKQLGYFYDWDRELSTSSKDYYRWTQWIFLKLHELGLAYEAEIPVNWCPALGTVLANEEVSPEGTYKETGDPVEKRLMKQWMLRITAYAQRLIDDLDDLDWPEPVKKMQREWIGRSVGARVRFDIKDDKGAFEVFTTRPDTLFGATYCVLAPEHELVGQLTTDDQKVEVSDYVRQTELRSERDRRADTKSKTGVFTGSYAINPVSKKEVPIWIADYVLASYGTGAIMAVPAHDDRDFEFAQAMSLPIQVVVRPSKGHLKEPLESAFTEHGVACNSGQYDGLSTEEFKAKITADLESNGKGKGEIQYALRDWLFSRQRYWGEPFPIVRTQDGLAHPIPEDSLPVALPHLEEYKPTEDGRPPLARAGDEWLKVVMSDGRVAERETNTMPQWAGSCWYYLRFIDPKNEERPWDLEKERYWMPVDLYVGGTEHAVLHLLYARFWHKVLYDLKLVSTKEPFQRLFNQGMIRAASFMDNQKRYYPREDVDERSDGTLVSKSTGEVLNTQIEKMGKSKLNSVNPDDIIGQYGADATRLCIMFMGPLDQAKPWQTESMEGLARFLNRVWRLFFEGDEDEISSALQDVAAEKKIERLRHQTIAQVTEDVNNLRFNTAISRMMEFVNALTQQKVRPKAALKDFLKLLAPFAPHITDEIWQRIGEQGPLLHQDWPTHDPAMLVEDSVEIPVQINGKVRARLEVSKDASEEAILLMAKEEPNVARHLDGVQIRKVIYRPGKMLNLVVG